MYKISQKMDFYAYSKLLKSLGEGTVIHKSVDIRGYKNVSIGEKCNLGHGVEIYGDAGIEIGDNVGMAPFVKIYSTGTSFKSLLMQLKDNKPRSEKIREFKSVKIGSNTTIFTNAMITPGVKIGENCIIGPNTIVNTDLDDNSAIFCGSNKIINFAPNTDKLMK